MGGAGLEGLLVVHHALHGIGASRRELLLVGLAALHHRHGQVVLAEVGVDVEHPQGLLHGLLRGGVHGVALLPQELPVAQEGAAGLLPAQDGAPLVVQLGQVPVGVDDVLIVLAEQGLGGGADAVALLQLLAAAVGDPGALGGEASTWSFSFWSRLSGMSMGRYTFSWPVSLKRLSSSAWMFSQRRSRRGGR